jgi:ankyrin repeat protein
MSGTPNRPVHSGGKLPTRANLEHLKNEAKQWLKTMRRKNPATRLSEAQLLVARGYGFPSWRKLKAHVEALHDSGQQLINAVQGGDLEAIRKILDRHPELVNASVDVPALNRTSDTLSMQLLHLAIAEGKEDVLRLLIERGADLNARNAGGRLALHDCFELNHDDFAKILLDAGAVPDVCAAAVYGMYEQLERILKNDPAMANDLTSGNSPLGWSVYGQQTKSATMLFEHGAIADRPPYDAYAWGPATGVASIGVGRVLLEHGANPNWQDEEGDTPIHRAIRSRLVLDPAKFIELLLEFGADVRIRNREGQTALDEALVQMGESAETYLPVRPIGVKKLQRSVEMLRARMATIV